MARLGCETKSDFQRTFFSTLAIKYFEGGNLQGRQSASITNDLRNIVQGLSEAWDVADEHPSE